MKLTIRTLSIVFFIAAILAITAVLTFSFHGSSGTAVAANISNGARATLHDVKNLHEKKSNSFYEKNSVVRTTREDVWIMLPNKYSKITDYSTPDGNFFKDVTINDGRNMAVITLDTSGTPVFADVHKNTCPFPGDERNFNPAYESYLTQLNELLDQDNFEIMPQDKKDKDTVKIKRKAAPEIPEGTAEYWYLDKKTSILKRSEVYKGDELIFKGEVEDLQTNTTIDESKFDLNIPENLSRENETINEIDLNYQKAELENIEDKIDYKFIQPADIPGDFKLIETGYATDKPRVWQNPVYLTYSNGTDWLYICEDGVRAAGQGDAFYALGLDYSAAKKIDLEGIQGYVYARGSVDGTLYFNIGNIKVKITSDVSLEELEKVAQSMING
jgi:outer membrane lipoprotein-sorting protein